MSAEDRAPAPVRASASTLLAGLPYAVFALLAVISWTRWIEPYVDSGRELMVPWRMSHGERLYRDVAFYHGPIGPALAAAVDRAAGRSLPGRTLLAAAIALAHVEALRRLAGRWSSPARAALAASLAVGLCAFLRPGGWLFPFSLDASIAVAALTGMLVWLGPNDRAAAVCLAVALLARPELGAAGVAAALFEARRQPRRWRTLAAWPGLAAAAAYALVSIGTPLSTLVSSGWLAILRPPPAFRNVYRAYAGLDQPGLRLAELALAGIAIGGIAALLAFAAKAAGRERGGSRAVMAVALLGLSAFAIVCLQPPAALVDALSLWPPLVRVVPAIVLGLAAARAVAIAARRLPSGPPGVSDAALILSALFSLRLLLAAGYAGPYNAYFLPLPALVATIAALHLADRARAPIGPSLPWLAAAALSVFLVFRVAALWQLYRGSPWGRVETPAGAVSLPEPIASTTRLAVMDLEARLPPGGSLVGFPEGGFFNYILGQRTPLREEQFFPDRLDAQAEQVVARRLIERPPDAVLLLNVHAVGEGARAFGRDYFVLLASTLERGFRTAAAFGPGAAAGAAIGDPQFFIEVRVPRTGAAP